MEFPYRKEEQLNALSHGLGALFAIFGFILLLDRNSQKTEFATVAIVVYSASLILLFTASAIYHITSDKNIKEKFRILDHISIYYLIAGTYTPVALITLIEGNGWIILYTIWGIAAVGTVLKLFYTGKYEWLSLLLYLGMGWLIILDYSSLIDEISTVGFVLLALGGAFYTLGIIFYTVRRIPYNHLIWHLFVLGGAISHWFYIYLDVI